MLLKKIRKNVIKAAKKAQKERLVPLTFGNFSIRDKKTGYICITPSGMEYQTLKPEDIVVCDGDGKVIEGDRRPSVELPLHSAVYRNRPDVFSIVHTHSAFCTAWACVKGGMPCITAEAADILGGSLPLADFAIQGSSRLAENTVLALGKGKGVLMANHGVLFADGSMDQALKDAAIAEENAKVAFLACRIGEPVFLEEETVKALYEDTQVNYGQRPENE